MNEKKMKPCIGCKHLVAYGAACKGGEKLERQVNPLTGSVRWRDIRFPDRGGFRLSPKEMRKQGMPCGPDAKLYETSNSMDLLFIGIGVALLVLVTIGIGKSATTTYHVEKTEDGHTHKETVTGKR